MDPSAFSLPCAIIIIIPALPVPIHSPFVAEIFSRGMLVACESDDGQDSDHHHPCLARSDLEGQGLQTVFMGLAFYLYCEKIKQMTSQP